MIDFFKARYKQKYRTMAYPRQEADVPDTFPGMPVISNCSSCCSGACVNHCPVGAIQKEPGQTIAIDMGKCIFCRKCEAACTQKTITFSHNYNISSTDCRQLSIKNGESLQQLSIISETARKYFKHSLKLRQVSAGGCNACEADANVLGTPAWDMGRFGIQFVASPRHADGLLVTGPVTKNMKAALLKTYEALPEPKLVIASGACAISGGIFNGLDETCNGVESVIPVDLYVPGCPVHPLVLLHALLRLIGHPEVSQSQG